MTLQVIFGALLSVIGILSSALGLIFFIGSHGIGSRLAAAGILGTAGVIMFVIGVIMFRRGSRFSPAGIRKELLRLARMNNGELTEEAIIGTLGTSDTVNVQLAALVREGVASERMRDNRKLYVIENVQMKMVLKKCPYCGNDYPVRDDIERCPTCGGDLKLHRTALALNEKKFSMDEEDDTGAS